MGLRRPSRREANLPSQSDAKVNEWSYNSTDTNVDLLSYRYFGMSYRRHLQGTFVRNTVNHLDTT